MTTTQAARILGVSAEFVRAEIRDGRLQAYVTKRKVRNVYRITPVQLEEYRSTHWRPTFHVKQIAS